MATSWALEAIEREAMARAHRQLTEPRLMSYMGVPEENLRWLVVSFMQQHGFSPAYLDIQASTPEKPVIVAAARGE